jgi:hypothetical protein
MKKLLFSSLVTLSLLSGCGGGDSGKSAPATGGAPSTEAKPADASTDGSVPSNGSCPNFKGVYTRWMETKNEDGSVAVDESGKPKLEKNSIQISTKVESGIYRYSFGNSGRYLAADGEEKEWELQGKGTVKVSCDKTSLTLVMVDEEIDTTKTQKYTWVADSKILVETKVDPADAETERHLAFHNGEFTKE